MGHRVEWRKLRAGRKSDGDDGAGDDDVEWDGHWWGLSTKRDKG